MKWRNGLVFMLMLLVAISIAGCTTEEPAVEVEPTMEAVTEPEAVAEETNSSVVAEETMSSDVTLGILTPDQPLERDKLVIDFALENLEGEVVQLSDYRGKLVLLNFWTTW